MHICYLMSNLFLLKLRPWCVILSKGNIDEASKNDVDHYYGNNRCIKITVDGQHPKQSCNKDFIDKLHIVIYICHLLQQQNVTRSIYLFPILLHMLTLYMNDWSNEHHIFIGFYILTKQVGVFSLQLLSETSES